MQNFGKVFAVYIFSTLLIWSKIFVHFGSDRTSFNDKKQIKVPNISQVFLQTDVVHVS